MLGISDPNLSKGTKWNTNSGGYLQVKAPNTKGFHVANLFGKDQMKEEVRLAGLLRAFNKLRCTMTLQMMAVSQIILSLNPSFLN